MEKTRVAAQPKLTLPFSDVLIGTKGLKKYYPLTKGFFSRPSGWVKAVDNITFSIGKGETLGVVGESGCGKSTLGKTLLRLIEPTEGETFIGGKNIYKQKGASIRKLRRQAQIIFQDPYSSINPRMKIGTTLVEPMRYHNICDANERYDRAIELLKMVGLDEAYMSRYPHEMSGGQLQRIGIIRALVVDPEFIVCDEVVSALDVSIKAQILNLLADLRSTFNLTMFFISHDLGVVRHISDRVAVMYLGEFVELADKKDLFIKPLHPYTEALLSAIPVANPEIQASRTPIILKGDVPSCDNPPSGCRFHTRCLYMKDKCVKEKPPLVNININNPEKREHLVSCHYAEQLNLVVEY